jgi:hypothetical protein
MIHAPLFIFGIVAGMFLGMIQPAHADWTADTCGLSDISSRQID